MYLVYYDEVKYNPPSQNSYWYGGVAIHHSVAQSVEKNVNKLAEAYFGSSALTKETEFHAKDIYHGKGNFKYADFESRMGLLGGLLDIAARDDVFGIYSKINVARLRYEAMEPQETAFTFFVEKVESFLAHRDDLGMLFGDYDQPLVGPSVATLSQFRSTGTYWMLGRPIRSLVDTVHFARSHHSRLVQLADVYLYSQQFLCGDNTSLARKKLSGMIRERMGLRPITYREYPLIY